MQKVKKVKKLLLDDEKVNLEKLIIESQNIKNKSKIMKEFKPDNNGFVSIEMSKLILAKYSTTKSQYNTNY